MSEAPEKPRPEEARDALQNLEISSADKSSHLSFSFLGIDSSLSERAFWRIETTSKCEGGAVEDSIDLGAVDAERLRDFLKSTKSGKSGYQSSTTLSLISEGEGKKISFYYSPIPDKMCLLLTEFPRSAFAAEGGIFVDGGEKFEIQKWLGLLLVEMAEVNASTSPSEGLSEDTSENHPAELEENE